MSSQIDEVGRTAAFGDIGYENAEHDAATETLARMRERYREIERVVAEAIPADPPNNPQEVCFGSSVLLRNVRSEESKRYKDSWSVRKFVS